MQYRIKLAYQGGPHEGIVVLEGERTMNDVEVSEWIGEAGECEMHEFLSIRTNKKSLIAIPRERIVEIGFFEDG